MDNLQKKIQFLLNLYKSKKLFEAELFNKKLITSHPKVVFLYNILGLILKDQEKKEEAIEWFEKGIKIQPDFAMIYNNLGNIYKSEENYTKAESYYKKSIDLDNKIPEPQNNLGNLYHKINKHKEAIACYKNAINNNTKNFVSYYNLGIVYKNIGEFKEAKKHLKKAVELNKNFCTGHRTLSQITKYTKNNNHFDLLKKLYRDSKISNTQKVEIAFALGKASDDINNFTEAFQYYREGNDLCRKNLSFSMKTERDEFTNIKKIFNKNLYIKFKQSRNYDITPIFILGMPRSGTTLIEQILSSHPKVFGGDELNYLPDLVKKYIDNENTGLYLKNIINIDKEKLKYIGHEYISKLQKISNNFKFVTDKLPINFKWIGVIKLILPNSKIVHCVRNPRDICLSIFKNYFVDKRLNFSYNLKEISDFYMLYNDLMKHWKNVLPKFVTDIKYEEVVQYPEQQVHNLLKACDLSWEANCLKFYSNKRAIKTASDTQARKRLYKSSVNSWKSYQKYIEDYFQKLPK